MKKSILLVLLLSCIMSVQAQESEEMKHKCESNDKGCCMKLKHNDQVLPRFFIDLNYKYGRLKQDFELIDLGAQYTNSIVANNRFSDYSFKKGLSHGGDFQIGLFIGRGRRFGLATGVNYFIQTGTISMDNPMHVEYRSTDGSGRIFRQHISSASPVEEEFKFTNINIPLMLKFKHQFRNSRLGFNLDAGGFINVFNKNKYKTNTAFDYEAIYLLDGNGNVIGYDNGVNPDVKSWLITKGFYNSTTPKAYSDINDFFNSKRAEGYNVGLAQMPSTTNKEGESSYTKLSYGGLAQLSLTYYLTYNVTFNIGAYYMYQLWNNNDDNNSGYRITDKLGDYSSMTNGVKTATATSLGMTTGFRFFFGEKRDLDWDGIADKQDKCVEQYGLLVNGGCPDTDKDGIIDELDECPDVAGQASAKGCPDRDGDGFSDDEDKCPDVAGEYQGCPIDKIVKDYLAKNPIKQPEPTVHYQTLSADEVYFEFAMSDIDPASYPVLDAAISTLRTNDKTVLFIAGYTDNVGNYEQNMKLSFKRAESVRKYIVEKGINEDRVVISGYGKNFPKVPNDSKENRAKNRRIEMKLLVTVDDANTEFHIDK